MRFFKQKVTERQKMTKYLIGFVILLVAIAVGMQERLWGSEESSESGNAKQTAGESQVDGLRVNVQRAKFIERIELPRDYTGTIKAERESQLSFERGGRLTKLHVDEGDSVTAGQLLATIDVELTQADLAAAKARLQQATAVLAELHAGPRAEAIASTQAKVKSLHSTVSRTQRDYERAKSLVEKRSISQERFDAAKFTLQSAVAERDATQKQLDELLAGTRTEKLDAQKAVVAQWAAQIRRLKLELEDGELRAPFAGRIAQRLADEGTVISSGTIVFQLVEDSALEAWVGVPASMSEHLQIGQDYTLAVRDRTVQATLESLRPQLDPITRTRNATLQICGDQLAGLLPGQIVRLKLKDTVECRGVRVPTSALVPGPRGLWNLFVLQEGDPNIVQQRNVELLYSLGEFSIVTGTIRDGEAIIADGVHRVVAGQKVQFLEPVGADDE